MEGDDVTDHYTGEYELPDPISDEVVNPEIPQLVRETAFYFSGVGSATPFVMERGTVHLEGAAAVFEDGFLPLGLRFSGEYDAMLYQLPHGCGVYLIEQGAHPIGGVACGVFEGIEGGHFYISTLEGHSWMRKQPDKFELRDLVIPVSQSTSVVHGFTGQGDVWADLYVLVDVDREPVGLVVDCTGAGSTWLARGGEGEMDVDELIDDLQLLSRGGEKNTRVVVALGDDHEKVPHVITEVTGCSRGVELVIEALSDVQARAQNPDRERFVLDFEELRFSFDLRHPLHTSMLTMGEDELHGALSSLAKRARATIASAGLDEWNSFSAIRVSYVESPEEATD